jgi:hypothetical protein
LVLLVNLNIIWIFLLSGISLAQVFLNSNKTFGYYKGKAMNKASSSFLLVIMSALFVSQHSFAQFQYQEPREPRGGGQGPQYPQYPQQGSGQGPSYPSQYPSQYPTQPSGPSLPSSSSEMISERVQQSLRMGQRLSLSELLRLSIQEQRQIQILSLSISAQAFQGRGQLDISSLGRIIAQIQVRRQLSEQQISLPSLTMASDLEISSQDDIFVESISAQIIKPRGQGGWGQQREQQPLPQQMLSLRIDQDIRFSGQIDLKELVRQQLGLTLDGSEIDRVIVRAQPSVMRGRVSGPIPSCQIELNSRLVGPMRPISGSQMQTPLQVNSMEDLRSLRLIINGDAFISDISIRIGQVRPINGGGQWGGQGQGQWGQRSERIQIGQEISANRPLELSRILPNEFRSVRSIALEARTTRSQSAEVALISWSGQLLASVIISQIPMKPVLQLMTPMSIRDIRLQSLTSVIIDSVEIEYDRSPR